MIENEMQSFIPAKTGEEDFDLYLSFLRITDFISGMTDSYAKSLYQELKGIILYNARIYRIALRN